MSNTELYGIKGNGDVVLIGECRNSCRGGFWIWNELSKKYLNKKFNIFNPEEVFLLQEDKRLTKTDYYALLSTFDRVVVLPEHMDVFADALEKFTPSTENLIKQASIIRLAKKEGYVGVCWNQISVCAPWTMYGEETDSESYYNVFKHKGHDVITVKDILV